MNKSLKLFLIIAAAAVVAWPSAAPAHETDQFSNRADPIADSTEVLNREVNNAIDDIVLNWRKDDDRKAFVNAVFGKLGSRFLVDRIERWAIRSPEVEKLKTGRYDSVYSGHPIWAVRVTKFFGVGQTIRLNDQLVGTDKLGHFVSQGRKYYRRFLRYQSEEKAAVQSAYAEWLVFGQMSNGNYSNADLVANYEGHRFFRSLFEDDIVPGKSAILRWEDNHWVIQREFDWGDHVNEYWDEALNINHSTRCSTSICIDGLFHTARSTGRTRRYIQSPTNSLLKNATRTWGSEITLYSGSIPSVPYKSISTRVLQLRPFVEDRKKAQPC
jgi:hypothetical protein